MERSLCIDQDDLVTGEGGGLTELGQGVIAGRTPRYLRFILEVPSETSLQRSLPPLNGCQFRVLVHASFGDHEGSGATELIVVGNPDDGFGIFSQQVHGGMTWFSAPWSAGALRGMMNLSDGDLKGVIHFKLFVAVEGLG